MKDDGIIFGKYQIEHGLGEEMKDNDIRKAFERSPIYGRRDRMNHYSDFKVGYKSRDKEISKLEKKLKEAVSFIGNITHRDPEIKPESEGEILRNRAWAFLKSIEQENTK